MAGRFRRLVEWFWLGAEHQRIRGRTHSPRLDELGRRAELAAELAERARRPAEPFLHGDGEALASELYRQAVYWALLAGFERANETVEPRPSFGWLWERTDPDTLSRAAGDAGERETLRNHLVDRTFADFADLSRSERLDLAKRLAAFTNELLNPLRDERRQIARIWKLRIYRFGALGLVALALAVIADRTLAWQDERRDLARRATWTASSNAGGGCRSPEQTCSESPGYFFHTSVETNPNVVFDLGRMRVISRVTVENRLDCCSERAVPLIVEVSHDQKHWKQLARRDEVFTTWRARFTKTRVRYVRLRVPGSGILHLARVKILP